MSSIDERIVEMRFDNKQFESNIKQTTKSLDDLKKGLDLNASKRGLEELQNAASRFSLAGLAAGVENLGQKFTALSVIGIAALASIASRAVEVGLQIGRSLTVDPIKQGLSEYETNLNSIQTILANTQSKGTVLEDVNRALQELNEYSDKTIYNFAEMARNIGTFTAAGVDLDTATNAIKGIANLAAVSGSSSQQAATAMYQLSQALATGTVKLMDWNSVVNAGMGGELFQNALKETARVHGVAIDEIIAKRGSFRDSLQDEWLTADILNETLSKLTGDLTDEQLKQLGYTEAQIVEIQKMAQTAVDAATKVKTLSQLIGTLQEAAGSGWAQTWQIIFGDFEEAKELFTNVNNVLGALIQESADTRNQILSDWKQLGGRQAIIDAIAAAFEALMRVLEPVKKAFEQIFPPATGRQLFDLSVMLRDFAEGLKIAETTGENLQRSLAGLFAVFGILWEIVKQVGITLFELFGFATEGSEGILEFTGTIGDFLVSMHEAIKTGEGLSQFFEGLKRVIEVPITLIRTLVGLIGDLIRAGAEVDSSGLNAIGEGLRERLEPLARVGEWLMDVWTGLGEVFQKIAQFLKPVIDFIGEALSGLGEAIAGAVNKGDFSPILDLFNTGLFAGLVFLVKDFFDFLKDKGPGNIVGGLKEVIGGITGSLEAMQKSLQAKTLLTIAGAIAILAASAIALSLVDPERLGAALGALAVMTTQLLVSMAVFEKLAASGGLAKLPLIAASMIIFGIALNVLASAVKKLAELDWQGLAKGLIGTTVLMGSIIAMVKLLGKSTPTLIGAGIGLIGIAAALRILVSSVTELAGLSWDELGVAMTGLGGLLALVVATTRTIGNPAGIISTSIALVLLGAALRIMASAMTAFADMSWEEIGRGMLAMAGALVAIGIAVNLLPKGLILSAAGLVVVGAALLIISDALLKMSGLSWDEIGRVAVVLAGSLLIIAGAMSLMQSAIAGAAALIGVAFALNILGDAFLKMAEMSWDDIGRVAVILAGSLLIIAGAMYLMTAALPGAAALVVVAGGLMLLAPVLVLLGSMSWENIGTGLGALAAVLGILAVAGLALIPALPGLVGLGIAIALVGVGAALAGAGVLAFAVGLAALTAAGSAGLSMIGPAIKAFADQIPLIAQKVGEGIIEIAKVISESSAVMTSAFTAVILSLIQAIVDLVPPIVDAAVLLIEKLVEALVVLIPLLVDAGLRLVVGILDGISKNIGKVVEKGTDLIVNFLDGIGKAIPRLLQAGANLIIDFINGLATTIRENNAKIQAAGANVADAIIDGMTSGISKGITTVINAIKNMANSALNAAKKALGIASPSKEFEEIGMFTDMGYAKGLQKYSGYVSRASADVGEEAILSMKKSLKGMSLVFDKEIDRSPSIRPVLDLSAIRKDAGLISSTLGAQTLSVENIKANALSAENAYEETMQARTDADGTPTGDVYNFTQNNTSPKALSAGEIYRQTKNQLSRAKGEKKDA